MTAKPSGLPCWSPAALDSAPPLDGALTVDVAVVGAGLAGCAVALRLIEREPGLRIALLDADRPAAGASGRGTGLVGPRIGPPIDVAVRRFGADRARANHEASVAGVAALIELAQRHARGSLQRVDGQLIVARTASQQRTLERRATTYAALGIDVSVSDTPQAGVALRYPVAAGVDPAALVTGLAAELGRRGVLRYDASPVRRIDGGTVTVCRLDTGRVLADTVVVTADGGARRLGLPVGPLRDVHACAVATAPLPADIVDELGGRHGPQVIGAGELAPYWRITADGRLILGGGRPLDVRGLSPARRLRALFRIWRTLESTLPAIHPRLAGTGLATRWSGVVTLTEDGLPIVGRLDVQGRVWFAGGWCGHGLAAGVVASTVVADGVLGAASTGQSTLPWSRGRAPGGPITRMPAPALRVALRTVAAHQGRLPFKLRRPARGTAVVAGAPDRRTPEPTRMEPGTP